MPSRIAIVTLTILLFEHCTTVTLTRMTQQRVDAPRPVPAALVLMTEILKLLMSMFLELTSTFGLGSQSTLAKLYFSVIGSPWDTLRLSVPAVLYTIQNLLIYVALGNLEIVVFQVLYQTKLMLTALLSVVCLGRKLGLRQWLALLALTIGVIAVELSDAGPLKKGNENLTSALQKRAGHGGHVSHGMHGGLGAHSGRSAHTAHAVHGRQLSSTVGGAAPVAFLGVLAALVAATLSSSAGIYFEAIIKNREERPPSLWVRNVQLCIFTLPIAAATAAWQWRAVLDQGLVIDWLTALLVVLNASGGLLVAAVIKHGVRTIPASAPLPWSTLLAYDCRAALTMRYSGQHSQEFYDVLLCHSWRNHLCPGL